MKEWKKKRRRRKDYFTEARSDSFGEMKAIFSGILRSSRQRRIDGGLHCSLADASWTGFSKKVSLLGGWSLG